MLERGATPPGGARCASWPAPSSPGGWAGWGRGGGCRGDETCQDGACGCPAGTKACAGNRCVAREVCCEVGDCRCPDDLRACGDQCIAQDACCADIDCDDGRVCVDGS